MVNRWIRRLVYDQRNATDASLYFINSFGCSGLNVCLHSRSFPLRADWRKSDSSVDGEPQRNWTWNSNSRDVIASSPSFSRPAARGPWRSCSRALFRLKWWTSPYFGWRSKRQRRQICFASLWAPAFLLQWIQGLEKFMFHEPGVFI